MNASRRLFLGALAAAAAWPAAASPGRRVVTIGGAITEIAFALDVGGSVAAVDTTSRWPAAARDLPNVGYLRQLSAEGIVALRPDLVIASHDAGPPKVFEQLQDARVRVRLVPEDYSAAGVEDKIRAVAAALGRPEGEALAAAVAADLSAVAAGVTAISRPARVIFLLAASGNLAPLAAGRNTAAAAMLKLSGAVNAVDAYEGYKPLSPEAAVALGADAIVLMAHTLEQLGGVEGVARLPQLAATAAAHNRRIFAFDGSYLLGFGPRTAHAARDLAAALVPDRELPALPSRAWVRG